MIKDESIKDKKIKIGPTRDQKWTEIGPKRTIKMDPKKIADSQNKQIRLTAPHSGQFFENKC